MANLTIATDLTLTEVGDGTPSNPGISGGTTTAGVTGVAFTYNKNNMSSAARMYAAVVHVNYNWSTIQNLLYKEVASYEDKKTLSSSVTRRGRRKVRGILYPRGSYIPYRRRLR